jgi:hypothetical protein
MSQMNREPSGPVKDARQLKPLHPDTGIKLDMNIKPDLPEVNSFFIR